MRQGILAVSLQPNGSAAEALEAADMQAQAMWILGSRRAALHLS